MRKRSDKRPTVSRVPRTAGGGQRRSSIWGFAKRGSRRRSPAVPSSGLTGARRLGDWQTLGRFTAGECLAASRLAIIWPLRDWRIFSRFATGESLAGSRRGGDGPKITSLGRLSTGNRLSVSPDPDRDVPPRWCDDPGWPPVDPAITAAVNDAMTSGQWGGYSGPHHTAALQWLTDWTGRRYARLMSSGSAAIRWALEAVGVGRGDRVAICALDYPGILRAVELIGARPVLVDCEADSPTMDVDDLRTAMDQSPVRAVVASHLFGVAAAIDAIEALCRERNVQLVEDACQTPGLRLGQRGAGGFGDISTWSFGGSKPLTAGCGGAVTFDDARIEARLGRMLDRPSDASPMSSLQCAVLLPQMRGLADQIRLRNDTASHLSERFDSYPIRSGSISSYYKFPIRLPRGADRHAVLRRGERVQLPVGEPFRSAGRRITSRMDRSGAMPHAAAHAESTILLDHRALSIERSRWASLGSAIEWMLKVCKT